MSLNPSIGSDPDLRRGRAPGDSARVLDDTADAMPRRRLARAADRVDQVPLPHLRAAGDAALLRDLVELLAVAVLELVTGLAAAAAAAGGLLAELAARALRQIRDRALARGGALRLLDVALGCLA